MTRQAIIEHTLEIINFLPEDRAEEISEFAEQVRKRFEDQQLMSEIEQMTSGGEVFEFLNNEDDLYTIEDLKEVYNG